MTISLTQAILLGLFCGIAKTCIPYTWGAFLFNTVIGNAVIVGAVMGDMKSAMIIGASLQLIYLGVISAGGNQPSDPCLASYIAIPFAMVSGLDTTAAVALAVPLGLLGPQITNLLYLAAGFFAQKGDKFIEKGDAKGMTRWAVIYVGIIRCIVFGVPVAICNYCKLDFQAEIYAVFLWRIFPDPVYPYRNDSSAASGSVLNLPVSYVYGEGLSAQYR